jgi:hypothetical protein
LSLNFWLRQLNGPPKPCAINNSGDKEAH